MAHPIPARVDEDDSPPSIVESKGLVDAASRAFKQTPNVMGGYDCKMIRWDGVAENRRQLVAQAGKAKVFWPPLCGYLDLWAGASMRESLYAYGFTKDGKSALLCGIREDCEQVSFATGKVTRRVLPTWPEGMDGRSVDTFEPIASFFKDQGAPEAPRGSFHYGSDFRISWRLARGARAVIVSMIDLHTKDGNERTLFRFPRPDRPLLPESEDDDDWTLAQEPIVLSSASFSPDGNILQVDVVTSQGGEGFDVGFVNLPQAAAEMYRADAERDVVHAKVWRKKQRAAETLAEKYASTFIY